MHILVVVAHPVLSSLTQSVAREIVTALEALDHIVELADLAAEGFSPVFAASDVAAQTGGAPITDDVRAEQQRVDRADQLVLVFPIYWWSLPALLKGWIDRVFVSDWAFTESDETGIVKKLGRLKVHLVALGGASLQTYAHRGYFGAMRLQIDEGIFGFCGASVITSELVLPEHMNPTFDPRRLAHAVAGNVYAEASADTSIR